MSPPSPILSLEDVRQIAINQGLNVKDNGKGFECYCPAHGDKRTRHLYVSRGDTASVVLYCQHCCAFADITHALGIEPRQLGAQPTTHQERDVILHDYRDADGILRYQVCRIGSGQGKKIWQRRPASSPGEWINNLEGVNRVLYRLPELLEAAPSEPVLLGEGEPVADTLSRSGFPATTNCQGAKSWKDAYAETLVGRRVAIFPDEDDDGDAWLLAVSESLTKRNIEHVVIHLPGLEHTKNHGADVVDWVKKNGHKPAEIREIVETAFAESKVSVAVASEWEPIVPLIDLDLPVFPIDALPPWIAEMVEASSIAKQTPADLAALLSLSVLAAAFQKRVEGRVRTRWTLPLSLWTMTSLPPGHRKSPVYADMVGPLERYEHWMIKDTAAAIALGQTEFDIKTGRWKRIKEQAIKEDDVFKREALTREAAELAAELSAKPRPVEPRLVVDDTTTERLGILLSEQGGRLAVMSPEGGIFDNMAGRYSSGVPNFDLYTKAHDGDDVRVDRVGRGPVVVRRPAISFGLTIQPNVLEGLAATPAFRGRGLLGRFIYSGPKSTLGHRDIRPAPVPESVAEQYEQGIRWCLSQQPNLDESGAIISDTLEFTPDADDAVADFEQWIEPHLAETGDLGHMGDWAGKLAGQMAVVTCLMHLGRLKGTKDPWTIPVDGDEVERATRIARFMIPHARSALQMMGADPKTNGARVILRWIKAHRLSDFVQRDCHRAVHHRLETAPEVQDSLLVLVERSYIRHVESPKRTGAGQPPSPKFVVNPAIYDQEGDL